MTSEFRVVISHRMELGVSFSLSLGGQKLEFRKGSKNGLICFRFQVSGCDPGGSGLQVSY